MFPSRMDEYRNQDVFLGKRFPGHDSVHYCERWRESGGFLVTAGHQRTFTIEVEPGDIINCLAIIPNWKDDTDGKVFVPYKTYRSMENGNDGYLSKFKNDGTVKIHIQGWPFRGVDWSIRAWKMKLDDFVHLNWDALRSGNYRAHKGNQF